MNLFYPVICKNRDKCLVSIQGLESNTATPENLERGIWLQVCYLSPYNIKQIYYFYLGGCLYAQL